jgi:AcrR family transcriptional regulator
LLIETKEKILKAALALFNSKGTEWVTVRDIAKKIGISHGNLCYHFPTTDYIIRELYFRLVKELDTEIMAMQQSENQPQGDFFKGARILFELLYKNKFLMLNFVDIMRRMPDLKKHYHELQKRRRVEFKTIFANLVATGIMKPELYPGYFDDFNINMSILGDFWISHAEITYTGKEKDKLDYYFKITSSPFLSLLTEKGLKLFLASSNA